MKHFYIVLRLLFLLCALLMHIMIKLPKFQYNKIEIYYI